MMNPRHSLRKVFGLYEQELNGWIGAALRQVSRVIDVGANDGYFAFGCGAAFKRLGKSGAIVALEPQERHACDLRASVRQQKDNQVQFEIVEALAGSKPGPGQVTLDGLEGLFGVEQPRENTLIKIDVEGAELDVIAGAVTWMHPSNRFLVEVHDPGYLEPLMRAFRSRGLHLNLVQQQPRALIGRESREPDNCWLVSALSIS